MTFIALTMMVGIFSTQQALSQCNNSSSFGTFTAPTGSGGQTMSTCIFGGEYNTINGAVAGQTYEFTSAGGTGNYLTVRQGTPGGMVLGFGFSPITVTVTASGPIYLHVNATSGCGTDDDCHTTTIRCTSCSFISNDLCTGALPILCGETITGSTSGAGTDAAPICATTFGTTRGVWYSYVGNGGTAILSLCGSSYDTKIGVFTGSCAALTCVTGNDDFCGLQSQVSFATSLGTTYFVLVTGFGSNTGSFTLAATCTPPPCPTFSGAPANVSITNSSCGSGCTLTGGSISAPTGMPCPDGSTLQYNVNNSGWTTTLPDYNQDGPAQSIRTRCSCDNDANTVSAESNPVTTIPGTLANPVVLANGLATVACPALATQPTPPVVTACNGSVITPTGPTVTNDPNPLTCEGTRTYTWTYSCGTTSSTWSFVYTIEREPFTVPANGAATVNSPALATQPTPPTVLSNCGETLTPTGPVVTNSPNPVVCTGTRTYAWTYTDCEGNTAIWSFVYTIIDNTPPTMTAGTIAACYTSVAAAEAAALAATTASDLCSTPAKTASTTGTCSAVITVTATDASNNSASVTYNTRIDNTPPTLVCRTGTVLLNNSSSYALTAADVFNAAASSDNCPGTLTVTNISPANISCSQLGQTIPVAVTVQDGCGNSTTCTAQITVQEGTALPSGWSSANIGNANGSGGFKACSGQAFTVTASGFSTLNSDVMHVAYQQLCGNGSITARVANVTGGGWAGVIMRESLSPGAKKAVLKTQFNNNIRRDLRLATNGVTSALNFFRPQHQWLQLTRSGNILTGYTSFDGTNWDFAFTAAISMTSCIQVGIFSESINANAVTTATFTNVVVTGTTPALAEGTSTGFESAEQVLSDFNITLAPNPSQGLVNLQFLAAPKVPVTIEVFNLLGECISRLPNQQLDGASLQLDLSGQAAGVYLVHISTADATPVVKQLVLTH